MNVRKAVIDLIHKSNILRQFSSVTGDKYRQPSSSTSTLSNAPKIDVNAKASNSNPNRILSQNENIVSKCPDKSLLNDHKKARKLLAEFNELPEEDNEGKRKLLDTLLNPACRGRQINIEGPFRVFVGYNLKFGERFASDMQCFFQDVFPITIGNDVMIGAGVHIYTISHPLDPKLRHEYSVGYPVNIGNNVLIGGKSIICPGVTIGDNVTVATGSVVTKDIPPNVLVAGSPAKIIRHLDVT